MSATNEKDYGSKAGIGQHIDPNRGPTGINSGQRSTVRNPESITPLDVDEANGRGTNAGKESK
jgi:hypothetical protein